MQQCEDESHVEFARRAMEKEEPDVTIEWTQTMSAAWVSSLADAFPDGTSVQDLVRAAAMARVMNQNVDAELEEACEDGDIEELSESVDELTGAITQLANGGN